MFKSLNKQRIALEQERQNTEHFLEKFTKLKSQRAIKSEAKK